jgi:hypothetical protein
VANGSLLAFDLAGTTLNQVGLADFTFLSDARITRDNLAGLVTTHSGVEHIDLATGDSTRIQAGTTLSSIGLTHDGLHDVVSDDSTSVIDLATRSIVGSIPVRFAAEVAMGRTNSVAFSLGFVIDEVVRGVSTDGGSSAGAWDTPVGLPVELDGSNDLGVSPDGTRVVVCSPCPKSLRLSIYSRDPSLALLR